MCGAAACSAATTGQAWLKFGTLCYGYLVPQTVHRNKIQGWALNSAVECHLHTVEVTGSNPVAPTISSSAMCRSDATLWIGFGTQACGTD